MVELLLMFDSEKVFISCSLPVGVLDSSVVYRRFKLRSDQTKGCKIGICCFSAMKQEQILVGS
jgi:hypothetical protein